MPCLVAIIALAFPRLAIILVVLFSNFLGRAYETILWPVLGFLFLPLTTLAYAAGVNYSEGSMSGLWVVVVILAVLADLGVGPFAGTWSIWGDRDRWRR